VWNRLIKGVDLGESIDWSGRKQAVGWIRLEMDCLGCWHQTALWLRGLKVCDVIVEGCESWRELKILHELWYLEEGDCGLKSSGK